MIAGGTRLVGLHVRYREFELGPIDVALQPGCTALVGTNGAGKSTLMRAMLGLETRSTGHLAIDQLSSRTRSDRASFRASVGWVPQQPEFPRFVTAGQCLAYAADLKGLRGQAARAAARTAAESANIAGLLRRAAGSLSGGQQKRLAIAQAIVHEPALLVLDEPTAGLDPVQRLEFREWITRYAADHQILVSTHMVEDIQDTATSTVVLHRGQAVFTGSTADLLDLVAGHPGATLDQATAAFLRELDQ